MALASKQFVNEVVTSWNKIIGKYSKHAKPIAKHTSTHSLHFIAWKLLPNQHFLIEVTLNRQYEKQKIIHRLRMITYIEIMQFLTHQGIAFCNHDKSRYSFNRGNFLEILTLLNQTDKHNYHCVCLNCVSIIIIGPTVLPPGATNNGRTTTMSLASAR
ncbi:hypothetical protein Mp_3g09850 [Marchantia polymorpha subsp. ruderalis]|uniref:DUF4371 domain-containing protein n=2 Tax=Marchantia polymorpha TaxID=3197 RepID=A0AAF6AZ67_MARPO|nr:hypothetical protein MARPO_0085s0041 [Marchantia polymorpha]BBN05051.1 hypothetical protein Mp_3g09850 [Marchantia polymorpha subsp. ruderalis]|eukprot:PTQ33822.1 hypothetical protein MARPO_0085s0041 [Marchantia polymorpha]